MKRAVLMMVCISASARNPFAFQEESPSTLSALAEGEYDGAHMKVMRASDGSLTVMIEKIPSTLGKAEGLGG
jgi:hypothetical protein